MRERIDTYDAVEETMAGLYGDGLLLMTGTQGNPMTIGWASIGRAWGRPTMTIYVRPSRFSFSLLEGLPEFTVNVPTKEHSKAVAICGTKSGRDMDKIARCGFLLGSSESISVPYIYECPIHYECKVVHKNDVVPADLDPGIVRKQYPIGDFHRVYFGEIMGVFREE
jgi:flavin reductase (DIM6/NTAB) family NADH-FMN oxidoreductase RutF